MTLVIVIFILATFSFISYKRLDWGLMLTLASLPLYTIRFNLFGFPSTMLEGMILLLFFIWFLKNYKNVALAIKQRFQSDKTNSPLTSNKIFKRYPFDIEIILVLVISFLAMAVSGFDNSALGIWKAYFFEPLLLYILFFNIFVKAGKSIKDSFTQIVLPLTIAAFYVSVFAIYQKITGEFIPNELWAAYETRRVTSLFGYPNAVGLFLGPIIVLCSAHLFSLRSRYQKELCVRESCEQWSPFSLKWYWNLNLKEKLTLAFIKLSIVCSILAIFFAKSEGAIIAIFVSLVLILFFKDPFNFLGKTRMLILAVILVVVAATAFYTPLREMFLQKITLSDFSGQVRKAQWQETGIMLRDGNWFLGAGLSGYQEKLQPYHQNGIYLKNNDPDYDKLIKVSPEYQAKYWQPLEIFLYPHNIFLNFWVELGLMGMLLFLWIIIKVFYFGFIKLLNEEQIENRLLILGVIMSMLVLVVHGIVDVPYFKNDLAVIFWLIVGMMGIYII